MTSKIMTGWNPKYIKRSEASVIATLSSKNKENLENAIKQLANLFSIEKKSKIYKKEGEFFISVHSRSQIEPEQINTIFISLDSVTPCINSYGTLLANLGKDNRYLESLNEILPNFRDTNTGKLINELI